MTDNQSTFVTDGSLWHSHTGASYGEVSPDAFHTCKIRTLGLTASAVGCLTCADSPSVFVTCQKIIAPHRSRDSRISRLGLPPPYRREATIVASACLLNERRHSASSRRAEFQWTGGMKRRDNCGYKVVERLGILL